MDKHILFLIPSFRCGGVERSLINLLNTIDRHKYKIHVRYWIDDKTLWENVKNSDEIDIQDIGRESQTYKYPFKRLYDIIMKHDTSKGIWKVLMKFENKIHGALIILRINKRKYDAVIGYHHSGTWRYTRWSARAKKRIVYYHQGNVISGMLTERQAKRLDFVVAVSDGVKDFLIAEYPFLTNKLVTIMNILPQEIVLHMSEEQPNVVFSNKFFNIVSCGRISSEKGFDLAIKASALLKEDGINFRYYIIGDGDDKEKLKKLAVEKGVAEEVVFLGFCQNPYIYINQCDLFVQPSYIDSFALTMFEAWALKKPIVTTKTVGAQSFVRDGENGLITDFSEHSIAEAIKKLIFNKELADQITCSVKEINFKKMNDEALEMFDRMIY